MTRFGLMTACVVLAAGLGAPASAAEKLTFYCSAQEDWCQLMARLRGGDRDQCQHDPQELRRDFRPD
jgi:hypothetical protein